jgi:nitrogen fixation protein FixH
MRRSAALVGLTAALALALAACSRTPPPAVTVEADEGGVHFVLGIDPALVGEANTATLALSQNDLRVDTTGITIAFDMPGMPMRAQRVTLEEASPGNYTAGGIRFPMSGRWRAVVRSAGTKGFPPSPLTFEIRDK